MSEFEDVKVIYDAFANQYRDYSKSRSAYLSSVDAQIIGKFCDQAQEVLDFGAGDGVRGAKIFLDLKAKLLVQADISGEMLKLCREVGVAHEFWDVSNAAWSDRPPRFDLILCLWNVLGHIQPTAERISVLRQLKSVCRPGGHLCLDVNNRHYRGYGRWNSWGRRIIDFLSPDYNRGDTEFTWEIKGVKYPAKGHLFIFSELKHIFIEAGWQIDEWFSVDYVTGEVSQKVDCGQLFFILK